LNHSKSDYDFIPPLKREAVVQNIKSMKRLKSVYKKNGYEHEMLFRTDKVAIYKQYTSKGQIVCYNVFKIKRQNA